jgi:hypothetical protein
MLPAAFPTLDAIWPYLPGSTDPAKFATLLTTPCFFRNPTALRMNETTPRPRIRLLCRFILICFTYKYTIQLNFSKKIFIILFVVDLYTQTTHAVYHSVRRRQFNGTRKPRNDKNICPCFQT